jgi:hypothetical protein
MTPKEKAEDLVHSFNSIDAKDILQYGMEWQMAKQCALTAIDEIVMALSVIPYGMQYLCAIDYWLEVKEEIEKL